jgi:CHAT domain-containing protein
LGSRWSRGDETGRQRALLLQAEIWARRGQPARAEALYREVIGSRQAAPESSWEARVGLARLHVRAARVADAEVEFALAFELMERTLSQLVAIEHRLPFFSSLGAFYDDYVDFLVAQGRVVEALELADRSHARLLRERLGTGARAAGSLDYPRLARELDALLLCYWTAAHRSFLWIVTPAGVELVTLPGERALGERVAGHQARILQSRDPLAEGAADGVSLYETLVRPAAAAIPPSARVLVVPDGPLHQLNFETLVVAAPEPRYWIEDVVLAIVPSLELLATDAGDAGDGGPAAGAGGVGRADTLGVPSLLVLGDPVSVGDELPPLPHAGREISRIAALFPPEQRRVFSGPRAEPAAYRAADPGRFTFIHFAAHAQANQVVPLDSAIVLSARDQDHKLYAREIVSLPLRAELVTLSACRSAGSRAYEGEGLVGLAWAFLGSGAANVVGGLWNVEDASTADLMEHLYRELAAGADPAVALRRAKLRLLRSGTAYRKPYYWGPFVTFTDLLPKLGPRIMRVPASPPASPPVLGWVVEAGRKATQSAGAPPPQRTPRASDHPVSCGAERGCSRGARAR